MGGVLCDLAQVRANSVQNKVILVVSGATKTMKKYLGHPNLGGLVQPRVMGNIRTILGSGCVWGADNDCFQGLDKDAYIFMLRKLSLGSCENLKFVTVPDVVGNHRQTLRRFRVWEPVVRKYDLPVAFVGQDGATVENVPWSCMDALFIGGSTAWKLSKLAAVLILEALSRGLWVHVGRLNSFERIRYFNALGASSFDGGQYSMFPETHIPKALRYLEQLQYGFMPILMA